jgi:leucyl aminopeptidase
MIVFVERSCVGCFDDLYYLMRTVWRTTTTQSRIHNKGELMRAADYYQTMMENTVPLVLVSHAELLTLTPVEQKCLTAQQFQGCLGDLGFVLGREGDIATIYVGSGEQHHSDALAIAHVVPRLPVGSYALKQTLSLEALVAWSLAQYQFDRYKQAPLPRILLVEKKVLSHVLAEVSAIFLVRDLINTPANDLGPKQLADVLETMARDHGAEFQQWVGDALLEHRFPAIHAVGRAAEAEPRLLSLVWGKKHHPKVTLVGKGVCFDSGGLDMKPSSNMRLMKKDMGGAAHVMGLAQWLMMRQVPIRLQVLIPAVENAVASASYRPGDVLTMRNGLNVEVHNTDAEGRLVLADALVKACEEEPDLIIDFATLTGAARVAVGTEIAAMFANNDELAQALEKSAKAVSDPIWRMPLYEGYSELFASTIADFSNASESSYAGAITAALFLKRFISHDIPWAHFDIMAWNLASKPGKPVGGEAMGIRAVGHYLGTQYGFLDESS